MRRRGKWWSVPVFAVAAALVSTSLALAQPLAESSLETDGETLRFSLDGTTFVETKKKLIQPKAKPQKAKKPRKSAKARKKK